MVIIKRFLLVLLLLVTFSACRCTAPTDDNTDQNGNGTSIDTTPPVITSVSASDISYKSVTIVWTTNEAATSQVQYGTTATYSSTTTLSTTLGKSHSVNLINLNSNTTYYYRVRSKDASGNETISTGKTFDTNVEEVYSRTYEWDFMGSSWTYTTEIPESDYDYFSNKSRVDDYDEYVLTPDDDEWMENLANLFVEQAEEEGWDKSYYTPFVLSFIQSMPYTSDDVTTAYDEYPRYPVETVVDQGGDCEDTSILFASIVRGLGYGVALLVLEDDEHMAAGVRISQSLIDNWDEDYPLTYYTVSEDEIYAYCETTGEGWGVGEMPDDLGGTAIILDVF